LVVVFGLVVVSVVLNLLLVFVVFKRWKYLYFENYLFDN
jgi:hypothetical protein